jgi:sugar phosphate isomerase/epimerase
MDHAGRFIFSGPGSWPLERAIQWATENGFSRLQFNADAPPNYPATFDPARVRAIREQVEREGLELGIHTSSAVNMAEITPVMAAAADEYLRQNLDLAAALGCAYVIGHGGFHFSSDRDSRLDTAVERMQRATEWADQRKLEIHFENHNKEPDQAEIHYLAQDVAETRRFFEAIDAPHFLWAANVGHAELVPEGFDGFLDAFGADRIGHVRLHDTHGRFEEHLVPGEGIVDFRHVFRRLSALNYRGCFTLNFGSSEQRAAWRETFAQWLAEVSA